LTGSQGIMAVNKPSPKVQPKDKVCSRSSTLVTIVRVLAMPLFLLATVENG